MISPLMKVPSQKSKAFGTMLFSRRFFSHLKILLNLIQDSMHSNVELGSKLLGIASKHITEPKFIRFHQIKFKIENLEPGLLALTTKQDN